MQTIHKPEKIDKKIFSALFFSIFSAVTGIGIVVPLLPVYAHDLGASGFYIALIFGGFSISRTIFLPIFGRWSDRKGRKPFLTIGLFFYFVISLAFILAKDINSLVILRFIQGAASAMIMPVAMAYVGDITPEGKEGTAMGIFNMSIFLGLSIGPLLGGAISDLFSLQAAFAWMAALALAAFFLSTLFLPPVGSEKIVYSGFQPIPWKQLMLDFSILRLFLFRMVYATCIGIIWGFLPVYGAVSFGLSSAAIGVLVMLGVAVNGVIHVPMGVVADRLDKRKLVIGGGVIAAAGISVMGVAGGFWGLFSASAIFGIGGGIAMPSLMALAVVSGNRNAAMGSVMAMITIAHSLGMLMGSLFAGVMMDLSGLQLAFPAGAVVMLAGVAAFILLTYGFSFLRVPKI
jgi:MFS transporter, DHA1 family, multidrug resistance protein